jgi:hypothetical protein
MSNQEVHHYREQRESRRRFERNRAGKDSPGIPFLERCCCGPNISRLASWRTSAAVSSTARDPRRTGMQCKLVVLLAILTIVLAGCGGNSGTVSNPTPTPTPSAENLTGDWEVSATSTAGTALPLTFVETNLTQASGSTSFASAANQTAIFSTNSSVTLALIGGCGTNNGTAQSVQGSISGSAISGTFTEQSGATFSFTGTLNAAQNSFTGTYSGTSAGCSDSGTFVATVASPLSGSYSGSLVFSDGTTNTLSLSVTANSSNTVSATGTITGPDGGTVNVSGTVVGDVAVAQGTETFTNGNPNSSVSVYAWLHNGQLFIADVTTSTILGSLTKH